MQYFKIFLIIISLILFSSNTVFAQFDNDFMRTPKNKFYRLGTTDIPENKLNKACKQNHKIKLDIKKQKENNQEINNLKKEDIKPANLTYADLSIKRMSSEFEKTLDMEFNYMQSDLSLLWQGAAMNSDTIKFAIYKLSNPDKDKPDENAVKKVLTTIAGMTTFVGAGTGNPMLSGLALIGGNTLGIMSQNDKELNYKFTRVNDADMIILVRKVDELQQKVIDLYYEYMSSRKKYNAVSSLVEKYRKNCERLDDESKDIIIISDAYYRSFLDEQIKARGNFFEKRSRLEQLVGKEVFKQFEENINSREY